MKYVGVDLHKHVIVLCVAGLVGGRPKVARRARFACRDTDAIRRFFQELGPFQVVVEATAAYEWFFQLTEDLADRLVLAHPKKLRVIAESTRKSDKIDAEVLASFLARDMIPESYRPTPRVRQYRALVRHRCWLQRRISALKAKLRSVLGHYNADIAGLFTRAGTDYLAKVALSPADRFVVEAIREQLALYERQRRQADQELVRFAEGAPLAEREARAVLASMPQVGPVTIDVVLSELGDWRRFSSEKKVAAFAGLDPGQRQSAGKCHELHIRKEGSRLLRWALVQAAWRLVNRSPRWHQKFRGLRRNTGSKKKAIVGIARQLIGVMFAMLRTGRPYEVLGVPNGNERPTPSSDALPTATPSKTAPPSAQARQKGSAPSRRRPRVSRSGCATG